MKILKPYAKTNPDQTLAVSDSDVEKGTLSIPKAEEKEKSESKKSSKCSSFDIIFVCLVLGLVSRDVLKAYNDSRASQRFSQSKDQAQTGKVRDKRFLPTNPGSFSSLNCTSILAMPSQNLSFQDGLNRRRCKNGLPSPERHRRSAEGDHDSGVDESTTGLSPAQKSTSTSRLPRKTPPQTPTKSQSSARISARSSRAASSRMPRSQSVPKPAFNAFGTGGLSAAADKKVPMNKIKVGTASSPNIKQIRSKVGSMENATHRPTGGNVKIENRKLEWKGVGRTDARNKKYVPQGGDVKVETRKLAWNAQSKVGSLENARHKAGGGEKKIYDQKIKVQAKSKVGSTDNVKHKAGGGNVKIFNEALDVKAQSKVGSLDNVKHKPGGGDKVVFNDVEYLRQTSAIAAQSQSSSRRQSASQPHSLDSAASPPPTPTDAAKNGSTTSYSSFMKRKLSPMSTGY